MTNVVSIFGRPRKNTDKDKVETAADAKSFEEIAQANKEREDKLKKERLEANKGVLKSYKIK